MIDGLYIPGVKQTASNGFCFLCGNQLTNQRTLEHVFPKWVLNRFNLWDKSVTLLNGSALKYRMLTVPCCRACNELHLASIENVVCGASKAGYEALRALDQFTLAKWSAKILYGLLHKEVRLSESIRSSGAASIVSPTTLEQFAPLHMFLQTAHLKGSFGTWYPWSVFVSKIDPLPDPSLHFWFRDQPQSMFLAVRLGDVGIITVQLDNGTTRDEIGPLFDDIGCHAVSPLQFDELAARVILTRIALRQSPKMITVIADGPKQAAYLLPKPTLPLLGLSHAPIKGGEAFNAYQHFLQSWRIPSTELLDRTGNMVSFVLDSEGHLDLEAGRERARAVERSHLD